MLIISIIAIGSLIGNLYLLRRVKHQIKHKNNLLQELEIMALKSIKDEIAFRYVESALTHLYKYYLPPDAYITPTTFMSPGTEKFPELKDAIDSLRKAWEIREE